MDPQALIDRLRAGTVLFPALASGLDGAAVRWRPGQGKWSVLEVICHLADEERLDFRMRLDLVLHRPGADWPAIDPEAWVVEHSYQSREFRDAVDDFLAERHRSLGWFEGLKAPDWNASYDHPRLGRMYAGDLLAAWATHDLLHARQIISLLRERVLVDSHRYDAGYAGSW
jgi:hypothetical protein